MLKSIQDHFTEQASLTLDHKAKVKLFNNIQSNIYRKRSISNAILRRSKVLSIMLVLILCFSYIGFNYLQNKNIAYIVSHFGLGNTADAGYIARVVSWDGTYTITLRDKQIAAQGDQNIQNGSEIVVEKGSRVSIATSNNAQAEVIGPAKIAFSKVNNQIIVDVKYSEKLDIRQDKQKSSVHLINNSDPINRDVLVVKTNNQTIIGKDNTLNIAIAHKDDSNIITNKDGNIVITNTTTNVAVEMRANQVATILDMEVRLFADSSTGNDISAPLLAVDINQDSTQTTQKLDIQSDVKDLLGDDGVKNNLENENVATSAKIATKTKASDNSDDDYSPALAVNVIVPENQNNQVNPVSEEEQHVLIETEAQTNTSMIQSIDVSAKTDNLLQSKKLLSDRIVMLLATAYMNYQQDEQKNICNQKEIISQLCDELHISCKKRNDPQSCSKDLHDINAYIKNNYIVTSDVQLIQ